MCMWKNVYLFEHRLNFNLGLITRDVLAVSTDKFYPDVKYMHSGMNGEASTVNDSGVSDVIDATVVVAKKAEKVDDSLLLAGEVFLGARN